MKSFHQYVQYYGQKSSAVQPTQQHLDPEIYVPEKRSI